VHGDPRTHLLLAGFVKNDFTQQLTHLLSLSMMVTLAVSWLNWTAESLVKSIKPNCSCCSSITRSSWMGMVLQSSMGEFANVSWAVVLVKSIGAAEMNRGMECKHTRWY